MVDDTSQKNSTGRVGSLLKANVNNGVPTRVAIDKLVPYARQARKKFDESEIKELAAAIKEDGLLNPLTVRPKGSQYEIIGGERRWRAARLIGLTHLPVLVRVADDEQADRLHLRENIQRVNLDTMELAQRVQGDVELAGGDLAVVAAKYGKSKPWVSKLAAIGAGGAAMQELVDDGVTADQAVLASVASLERRAPEQAKALVEELKAAPPRANQRVIAEGHLRKERGAAQAAKASKSAKAKPARAAKAPKASKKASAAPEAPAWRSTRLVDLNPSRAAIVLGIAPSSEFAAEFGQLEKKHGDARLSVSKRHHDKSYAVVQFGGSAVNSRVYRADELRLLSVR